MNPVPPIVLKPPLATRGRFVASLAVLCGLLSSAEAARPSVSFPLKTGWGQAARRSMAAPRIWGSRVGTLNPPVAATVNWGLADPRVPPFYNGGSEERVHEKRRIPGGWARIGIMNHGQRFELGGHEGMFPLSLTLSPAFAGARGQEVDGKDNRAAPETWTLWRCGPIPFPNIMRPLVPESVPGAAIDFGKRGADLVIVMPDAIATNYDGRALRAMVRLIRGKVPRAVVMPAARAVSERPKRQLLVVGTLKDNSFARLVLGGDAAQFMNGIPAGGYHLGAIPNPYYAKGKVILALGADGAGAWPAAGILAYAIHPERRGLTSLHPWPFELPSGTYWSPFEAKYTLGRKAVDLPPVPDPRPSVPRVVFGVRIWGSPMPDLESFQRLIQALKPLGINTIAIQGGGWVDLPDAPEIYRKAVELAWREGIFTIVYVGNDMVSHHPAPLTANHKAIVRAIKDEPGLLEWHLYNQLSGNLEPAEWRMVEQQMHWLTGISSKRVGVEVVWGHDSAVIPPAKIRLIENLKRWGMTVVANDDAPIGGWSKKHDISVWEPRLLQLKQFGLPMEAVIQAHVPFVDPTIPSPAEVRNQFWWAAAGGARGFLFETAYLFTQISVRGILSWNLQPLPDGRYDEIRRLAGIARAMEPVLTGTAPGPVSDAEKLGLDLEPDSGAALRVRRSGDGAVYVLLINRSTETPTRATISMHKTAYSVRELAPGGTFHEVRPDGFIVNLEPGGGACFELTQ